MQTNQLDHPCDEYLLRIRVSDADTVDASLLRRAIEYLGGVATSGGFAFPTYQRRAVARELLGEKFGDRYFFSVDRKYENAQAS